MKSKINLLKIRQENYIKEILEEKENIKILNNRYKMQFDELREKVLSYQDINQRHTENMKTLDSRYSNTKYQLSALKKTVGEKDKEISSLREELNSVDIDAHYNLREKNENLWKKNKKLKDELDRKTKKLKEVEKSNSENKLRSDEYYKENQKDNPQRHYIELLNANIKTLKNIREQNKILKKELWKYDKNPEYDPLESERDRSFLFHLEKNNKLEKSGEKNNSNGN